MKKLLIIGKNQQLNFWDQHLNLNDVTLSIFEGDCVNDKIDDFKPDVIIMDEYFHDTKFKDVTKRCISEGIKYYICSDDEDVSISKYQLSHDVIDRINESLL